ncbi:MAG: hypothetical protein KKA73_19895 [Chloroflexi bacterium]|nr:hypothetical protein [Chloroflexota bacterium]
MISKRQRLVIFAIGNGVVVALLAGGLIQGLVVLDPLRAVLVLSLLVVGDIVAALLLERTGRARRAGPNDAL